LRSRREVERIAKVCAEAAMPRRGVDGWSSCAGALDRRISRWRARSASRTSSFDWAMKRGQPLPPRSNR
jgi:hypothetical protein